MTAQEQVDEITKLIDAKVNGMSAAATEAEKRVFNRIQELVKQLKTTNGRIDNSVENLRLIARMKPEIEKAIFQGGYQSEVAKFAGAFDQIAKLNNNYFSTLAVDFSPKPLLKEIRNQAVKWSVEALTESGISATFTQALDNILRKALTTGGSYADMTEEVRAYVLSSEVNEGAIARYARQVTTDAVNQYSATYNQAITQDLGLVWRMYTGSNLITTRPWCMAMTKKRYVHEAELEDLINKEVDGVEICSKDIPCNKRTKMPRGMIAGTNATNIIINRGGWQCRHQWVSMTENMVPLTTRIATYDKYGIQHKNGVYIKGAKRIKPKPQVKPEAKPEPPPEPPEPPPGRQQQKRPRGERQKKRRVAKRRKRRLAAKQKRRLAAKQKKHPLVLK